MKSPYQVSEPSTKQLIHSSRLTFLFPSGSQDSEDGKWIANNRLALFEELWEHCNALSVCNTPLSKISITVSVLLKESQSIANSIFLFNSHEFYLQLLCKKKKSPYDGRET